MVFRSAVRDYRALPGPIWALAAARMVNAAGSFVFPFLTLILTDRLGFDESQAGVVIMVSTTMFVPGSLIGGWLADRLGRKTLLIASQAASALCLGIVGFMDLSPTIIWFILAMEFFLGLMMPASSAAAYDLTTPENRKSAFSLLYLSWNLGFAVGPLLAGYLYESHFRWLFLGDAGTTWLSLVFILLFLPETRGWTAPMSEASAEKPEEGSTAALLWKRPALLVFVVLMVVPWFIYAQHSFAMPMFAKALFPETGAALYGRAMSLNAVIVVVLTVPLIRLTRCLRPVANVAIHAVLYGLGFGLLALFQSPPAFYLSVLIWTSGEILGATNIEVYTANHTPASHRGRFTSILPLISGTGRAISPWLTGLFLMGRPLESVWLLCLILGGLSGAAFAVLGFVDRSRTARS